jgi:circadian clock protein KaiC
MQESGTGPIVDDALTTGVPGLDDVLRGGIKPHALHLVIGGAGTGKTVLAHQVAFHMVAQGAPVLYCTAPVESHQTLLAQARTFEFFDPTAVSRTFHYASLQSAFEAGGVGEVRAEILRMTQQHAPQLVIVDGVHAFSLFARSAEDAHGLLVALQTQAASTGIPVLLISSETGPPDERLAVPDVIVQLDAERPGRRRIRTLEVIKCRGRDFLEGPHTFSIDSSGVSVYPRIEATVGHAFESLDGASGERLGTGIPALDSMLRGGLASGSVTLLPGSPGTGKTLLGLSFLSAGVRTGQSGLHVGFHETPARLVAKGEAIGLPLSEQQDGGSLHFVWQPSTELMPDAIASDILRRVRDGGFRRLVIDGLDDLIRSIERDDRVIAFLNAFLQLIREEDVAAIITEDLRRIFMPTLVLPLEEVSAAFDNILLLRYAEREARLRRYISALKVREVGHDLAIREFTIESTGITIGDPFDANDREPPVSSPPFFREHS